ncbi:MAG: hypothetical protein EOO16_09820 [Chitinophagaceae bacterium]|nr:MAG: hypothetical protein EOO16_09820 [Chitinophagaceae bacterium]
MTKSLLILLAASLSLSAAAQSEPDQNPQFAVSREKYLKIADSLNRWHATTLQNTYKAYDWYEARAERRDSRRNNRQAVRLARAQRQSYYDPYAYSNPYYYNPYYNNSYNHYRGGRRSTWGFWW